MKNNLLVFDVGGTTVKHSRWQNENLKAVNSFPTPPTWDEMKYQFVSVKEQYELESNLDGVAFSIPGAIMQETGVIVGDSAIPYIHNFSIKAELEAAFNLPVTFENDAKCAALAEVWQGAARGEKEVLFVIIGTGIGGAIITDGKLSYGAHHYTGEFGYMVLNSEGQGFSELSSPVRMAERYCDRIGVSRGTHTGKVVFDLAKNGDPDATAETEKFYQYTALALYNLQTAIDPAVIVIGGGISANAEIVAELEKRVNQLLQAVHIKDFSARVIACAFGNNANLIGAVKHFIDINQDI